MKFYIYRERERFTLPPRNFRHSSSLSLFTLRLLFFFFFSSPPPPPPVPPTPPHTREVQSEQTFAASFDYLHVLDCIKVADLFPA